MILVKKLMQLIHLINQGADIIVQHTDTFAPCQAAEKAGVMAFGQASDQSHFCPNAHLTAIVDDWGPYYTERAQALVDGSWSSSDTWGGMNTGMVAMAPYNKLNLCHLDLLSKKL